MIYEPFLLGERDVSVRRANMRVKDVSTTFVCSLFAPHKGDDPYIVDRVYERLHLESISVYLCMKTG